MESHADTEVSAGVTRCDINLNAHRQLRRATKLRELGWVPAGPVVAKLVNQLVDSHPHLSRYDSIGIPHPGAAAWMLNPANDTRIWWTREWCHRIGSVSAWPMVARRSLIIELDGNPDVQATICAAHNFGGEAAVAALDGYAWPRHYFGVEVVRAAPRARDR